MNTNFFNQIAQLNLKGDLQITISNGIENQIVVSVILNNENCGDDAKNLIIPFNLRATPEEMDEGFIAQITTPMKTVSGIMTNMEAHLKQIEEAKKNSAIQKGKIEAEQKETDSKEKRYKDAVAKAEALGFQGKVREAWSALPKTSDYPQYADDIRAKKEVYERQFAPDLFNTTEPNS